MLSVYVVRPRAVSRTVPLSGGAPWRQVVGHELKVKRTVTCTNVRPTITAAVFADYLYYFDLAGASENWTGSFQPQTSGLSPVGAEVGQGNTAGAVVSVSGSFAH